ncbi:hypothetical protein Tco_1035802, partial [Tanacetum coccineum]
VGIDLKDLDSQEDDQTFIVQDDEDEEVHIEPHTETKTLHASILKDLKELPTKFSEICGEIKDLKKYVEELEIELPIDLKETPTKLEDF